MQEPKTIIESVPKSRTLKLKVSFKKLGLTVLVTILVISAGYLIYNWHKRSITSKTGDCTKAQTAVCSVLREAVPLLDASKVKDLALTVNKIKSSPNYQQNPNLMYVLTMYYIDLSDSANARSNFDQLNKVYSDKVGYDPVLYGKVVNLADLKKSVEFLEQQAKNVKENEFGITPH